LRLTYEKPFTRKQRDIAVRQSWAAPIVETVDDSGMGPANSGSNTRALSPPLDDIEERANECSPMGSVDKALRALLHLAELGSRGSALSQLAGELGINKTSLHLTLAALRHRNFVEQDPAGNYRLGPALLSVADKHVRDASLRNELHRPLFDLCGTVHGVCNLGVLAGQHVVFLDKIGPLQSPHDLSYSGLWKPALSTALGLAILSKLYIDYESFAIRFSSDLAEPAPHGDTLSRIWAKLLEAHKRGFAYQQHEAEPEVVCIAVAIMRGLEPVGAVSVRTSKEILGTDRMGSLVAKIHECVGGQLPNGLTLQHAYV